MGQVSISFSADEAGSTFKCSLDGGAFTPCSSPYEVASPAVGPHTFTVEATNQAGIIGAASPSVRWSSVEPEHDLCGALTSNTTIGPDYAARYIITCATDVPALVTLTAQPGTIIKADQGTDLTVEGVLHAVGTEAEPVTFTSINDNSVGGTTGTGKPAAGDWQGIVVSGAGSVAMTDSAVSYAQTGLAGQTSGSVSVAGGQWAQFSAGGLSVSAGTIAVNDSTVLNSGAEPAFAVFSENLNLDQLTGNSATGGLPAFFVSGTVSTSSTLHSEGAPWLLGPPGCGAGLTIASGVTATVEAGAVIKGGTNNYVGNCGGPGGALTVQGSLVVAGTSASPVTFTSINDNSVGGTTGTGKPAAGDWQGIVVSGAGSVAMTDSAVSYAQTGLAGQTSGSVSVAGGQWAQFSAGGLSVSAGTIAVNDSTVLNSGAEPAFAVFSENLNLDQLTGNSATGGLPAFFVSGTVSTSSTLHSEGAPWLLGPPGCGAGLTIASGVTATVEAGAVIKGGTNNYVGNCGGPGGALTVQGSLVVAGTSASPVTFTSINDNSVGGTTGTGKPAAGDWQGIVVSGAGSVAMTDSAVSYAQTGLAGQTSGSVSVAGGQWAQFSAGGLSVSAGTIAVNDSTVLNSGAEPAFAVFSENLNLDQLTGNSATGGLPAFFVSGTVSTSSTLHSEGAPWLLGPPGCGAGLTIASGVTATVEAGAVIKGGTNNYVGNCGGPGGALTVQGSLVVAGTSASPVTFTSINDNSVGGTTGTGKPAAGDWQGIVATPSSTENPVIMLEHASVSYATTGLDATTNRQVTVQSDSLAHNGVAVNISATIGTNAAIHETWFDENGVALTGSSDWNPVATPVTSCEYIPTMAATGNTYGPSQATAPFLTKAELAEIAVLLLVPETETSPGGWPASVGVGPDDRVTWSVLPCQPLEKKPPHAVVATPFNF